MRNDKYKNEIDNLLKENEEILFSLKRLLNDKKRALITRIENDYSTKRTFFYFTCGIDLISILVLAGDIHSDFLQVCVMFYCVIAPLLALQLIMDIDYRRKSPADILYIYFIVALWLTEFALLDNNYSEHILIKWIGSLVFI